MPVPPGRSPRPKTRSNSTVAGATGTGAAARPGRSHAGCSSSSSTSSTWNSGCRAVDRAGFSASTTCSNGRSWWAYAARSASRARVTSSVKDGSPPASVRSTRVLRKNPTTPSRDSSVRSVTGVPSGMSSPAPSRDSSRTTAACATVNRVVSHARAMAPSRWCVRAPTVNGSTAPRWLAVAGRGRSVGSSSWSGRPARVSVQWASWVSSSPLPLSRSACCQRVKSAYWTGRGAQSGARPALRAVYAVDRSRARTPIDQPSAAMWCTTTRSTWAASSARLNRVARRGGAVSRANRRPMCSVSTASSVSSSAGTTGRSGVPGVPSGSGRSPSSTSWCGTPSRSGKTVRSGSWRAITSAQAARSAGRSRLPVSRTAMAML